jgi:hypothetical protein
MFEDFKYEEINGLRVRKEDYPYTPEEEAELYRQDQKVVAFTRPPRKADR